MAHVKKFTKGAATRILEHCERVKDETGKYRKYNSGSNIDDTKTKDNYSFLLNGKNPSGKERLNEILAQTYVMNRKDVNVMADWLITLPKDFEGDEHSFFKACAAFVVKRYGKECFVGGYVHKDESSPHIHLCFVPRVYDEKKGRWKVNAKTLLDKRELGDFQKSLEVDLMSKGLVKKGQILNGVTKSTGGNKTIPELKALSERVEKVKGLVAKLDGFIPDEDIKEISGLLEEINSDIHGNDIGPTLEYEIGPTVAYKKEKVR